MLKAGTYKNKRGDTVVLTADAFGDTSCTNGHRYNDEGICQKWHVGAERYYTHTDSQMDIEFDNSVLPDGSPNANYLTDEQRLEKLEQATKLLREVEFSYEWPDYRRQSIYRLLVSSVEWRAAVSNLTETLGKKVRGF